MSARYIQSLKYNIQHCDWLLTLIHPEEDNETALDAQDFLLDLKDNWLREIADVGAQMARQEARVV